MENVKKRRPRRSQVAIERDILESLVEIVKESGFEKVSLIAVAQRAEVQLSVIYRHFGSLDKLIDRYVQSLDYWLNTVFDPKKFQDAEFSEVYSSILQQLVNSFSKSVEMQKLMIWELSDDNHITRRTLKRRELINEEMLTVYNKYLGNQNIDIAAVTAIIAGGIYYTVINKKRSRFFGVDFSSKQGRERLVAAVAMISDSLFTMLEQQQQVFKIAKNLKDSGVPTDIICKATNLELATIECM